MRFICCNFLSTVILIGISSPGFKITKIHHNHDGVEEAAEGGQA